MRIEFRSVRMRKEYLIEGRLERQQTFISVLKKGLVVWFTATGIVCLVATLLHADNIHPTPSTAHPAVAASAGEQTDFTRADLAGVQFIDGSTTSVLVNR